MQNRVANHFSVTLVEIEPKTPPTTLQGGEAHIRFMTPANTDAAYQVAPSSAKYSWESEVVCRPGI